MNTETTTQSTKIIQKSRGHKHRHIGPQTYALIASWLTSVGRPFHIRRVRPAGEILSEYRNKAKLSQADLAGLMRLTKGRIIGLESAINISPENQKAFGDVLGIPASRFQPQPLLPWAVLALRIISLSAFYFHSNQAVVNKPSTEFNRIHDQYPRPWEKLSSWNCYRKLGDSDQALVPVALDNYKEGVNALRRKSDGSFPAWQFDRRFFCESWKNFKNE